MLRLGLIGCWHVHARDYAREAGEHPETEVVAVWDDQPERGRAMAESLGARFVDRLDDLLADPAIDGVIVTTATTAHGTVMPAAARAGKHLFAEKVIAPTWREARQIVDAVEAAGVALVVSLPRLASGSTRVIQEELDAGRLGQVTHLRVRLAHSGAVRTEQAPDGWLPARFYDPAEAAGGALIDLGCHPLYLTRLFLGLPETVSATYGSVTGRAVEDHAVVALGYASGAIGVAEVGFVNGAGDFAIEANGTAGSLRFGPPDDQLHFRAASADRREWTVLPDLPPDGPSPFAQWVAHVQAGTTAPENVALALDLSALVEAANRSARDGRVVPVASVLAG